MILRFVTNAKLVAGRSTQAVHATLEEAEAEAARLVHAGEAEFVELWARIYPGEDKATKPVAAKGIVVVGDPVMPKVTESPEPPADGPQGG